MEPKTAVTAGLDIANSMLELLLSSSTLSEEKKKRIRTDYLSKMERVFSTAACGEAGGGIVTINYSPSKGMHKLNISDEAMQDRGLLETLIIGACNDASAKYTEFANAEGTKLNITLATDILKETEGMSDMIMGELGTLLGKVIGDKEDEDV